MHFDHSSGFKKSFKKLSKKEKSKFYERMEAFINDEFDFILKNHKLNGEYDGCRSINITSDIRVIYRKISEDQYNLQSIGTHSELYE